MKVVLGCLAARGRNRYLLAATSRNPQGGPLVRGENASGARRDVTAWRILDRFEFARGGVARGNLAVGEVADPALPFGPP
jgi:hypothetical protein